MSLKTARDVALIVCLVITIIGLLTGAEDAASLALSVVVAVITGDVVRPGQLPTPARPREIPRWGAPGQIGGRIRITVRATDEVGGVLLEFESDHQYEVGDTLTLPDGVVVKVVRLNGTISDSYISQTLFVGDDVR
jgi:hypothetical protein